MKYKQWSTLFYWLYRYYAVKFSSISYTYFFFAKADHEHVDSKAKTPPAISNLAIPKRIYVEYTRDLITSESDSVIYNRIAIYIFSLSEIWLLNPPYGLTVPLQIRREIRGRPEKTQKGKHYSKDDPTAKGMFFHWRRIIVREYNTESR